MTMHKELSDELHWLSLAAAETRRLYPHVQNIKGNELDSLVQMYKDGVSVREAVDKVFG